MNNATDKIKILLIDDDKKILESLKKQLQLEGYEVIATINGDDGLIATRAFLPDIIICDWRMPKKDGHQVLKEIKKDKNFERIPFIMLTAVDGLEDMKTAYEDKADFYITKPVDFYALVKNIRLLLNLAKSREED